MMRLTSLLISLVLIGSSTLAEELATVAESSGYKQTSTSQQSLELLDQLARAAQHVTRFDVGHTVEGRRLAAVTIANPPIRSLADLRRDNRMSVLLLGNIHSGECAGKEALLALVRDLSRQPEHEWLKRLAIVVLPNYNADGNDRRGAAHRPGQVGPERMGTRENAQGLDLNRDFIKLDAPEARALVNLINEIDPKLFIDLHTTNGSRHRYQLTYDIPHNPAAPAAIRDYMRQKMMPNVTSQLSRRGIKTFYYGNFDRAHKRWTTYGHQPRYSTEYMGLRGRLGILSEAYSYVTYEQRITASREFVNACLNFARSEADTILQLVRQVDSAPQAKVGLQSKLAAFPDKFKIKGYALDKPNSQKPQDHEVEFFGRFKATHSVDVPQAYLLPRQMSRVVDRLRMHGIQLEQLERSSQLEVQQYTVRSRKLAPRSFQGHRLVTAEVTRDSVQRTLPAGTYVVRTHQPLGRLVAYLLEPASDDGLLTWNFFDEWARVGAPFPALRLPDASEISTRRVAKVVPSERLTLDRIYGPLGRVNYGGSFSLGTRWIRGTTRYSRSANGRTFEVEAATGAMTPQKAPDQSKQLAAIRKLPGLKRRETQQMVRRGMWNKDRTFLSISHRGDLFLYDAKQDQAFQATKTSATEELARFSPDGKRIAYVRSGNLYFYDVKARKEIALTTKGNARLLHGKLDWVYQEELYGRGNFVGFWWSPSSHYIAYLRLDESPVRDYTVADNIPVRQRLEVSSYPKSGDPIPKVALAIADVRSRSSVWLNLEQYQKADFLIPRVSWAPTGDELLFQVQDRAQTWLDLRRGTAKSSDSERLFRDETKAWVSARRDPTWLEDGGFLWLSERSGNQHIYHSSIDTPRLRPVTSGDWDVRSIIGVDPKEKWVYFTGTKNGAVNLHAYRASLKTDGQVRKLTDAAGSHSVRFNDSYEYFLDYSSTVHSPIQARLFRTDGTFVRTLDPNLDDRLRYLRVSRPERHRVKTHDGFVMDAMLIKPPDYSPDKRYPVLIYVYSGPQAPVVRNRWAGSTYLWHQMLAQKGYCVWMCDNRSATYRGAKHAWPIHRSMGTNELADIEDGIKWLVDKGIADPKRVGIWGWSYGGYMTSFALTHSKMFKVGIAGAPVTDWRNYDAVYTERYMGLPQ